MVPVFIVYGLYFIISGSSSPGGAFGGGMAFGAAGFLVVLARENSESWVFDLRWVHISFVLGLGVIIFSASLSLLLGGGFLDTKMIVGGGDAYQISPHSLVRSRDRTRCRLWVYHNSCRDDAYALRKLLDQ